MASCASCANCVKLDEELGSLRQELGSLLTQLEKKTNENEAQAKAAHGIERGLEKENDRLRESQSDSDLALSMFRSATKAY